jgi:hypothetical protein
MLVSIPLDGEEGVYKRLRESEFYKGNFGKEYYQRIHEARSVVEAAKIYIMDNYAKVKDWTEVHFNLVGYGEKERSDRVYFGMKDAERKRRYPPKPRPEPKESKRALRAERMPKLAAMLKRMDEEKIQVETFEAVYDWTDGDFSITVNGKEYWWIDHHNPDAIIEIAHFIENQLQNGEQTT